MVTHNLPQQPYKKFFGRKDSIIKIEETLLKGATFIASIDGIGGIGKTALAYYFCKEILIPNNQFENIIWVTAKEEVFDPFSTVNRIKSINNKFEGISTLIDETLDTIGFEEYLDRDFQTKKDLFEEFVKSDSILIILDNLENINDDDFFKYIKNDFNKFALVNKKLKVLTTSRKRKKIIDNPIEIEGLDAEDALKMLKFLAKAYGINDILNANPHDNLILVEKVGKIPLGIEFIIGQLANGKSRGEIYQELEGYPSLEGISDGSERKKVLSDIIMFSFQNMYESLGPKEKKIFQIIAAFQKNKNKNDPNISLEFLLSITNMTKAEIENIIETLTDNKLIIELGSGLYGISPLSINFVKQYYDNFENIEDEVVGKKKLLLNNVKKQYNRLDILINNVNTLIEENKYEEAEEKLIKALDLGQNYVIYYELAKIQRVLNKFSKSSDNFKTAAALNPNNTKIWFDWINMEDSRKRYNITMDIIDNALKATNNDVSIVLQKIGLYKYKEKFEEMRNEIKEKIKIYEKEGRNGDILRLLRNWKNIEYNLLINRNNHNNYFEAIEKLIEKEINKEIKLQLMQEELKIAKKVNNYKVVKKLFYRIESIKTSIYASIGSRIKKLNKLFSNKEYDKAKKEARKIIALTYEDDENIYYAKDALRILLLILSSEKDYEKIISIFEEYKEVGYKDKNCTEIYKKSLKEIENKKKDNIIKEISSNIQNIELSLRDIIIKSLNNSEEELRNLIIKKGKKDWIEQWEYTKNKSLKNDANIIHYSDLGHLRSLLSWQKNVITQKTTINQKKARERVSKIVAYLENYVSKERNDAFHSRLQLYDFEKLNEILVDTKRLLHKVEDLNNIMVDFNE